MNMQHEIRLEMIRFGSSFADGKKRIAYMVESGMDDAALAKALAKEYGIGGHSMTYSDGTSGFVDHDGKGIRYTIGKYSSPQSSVVAPWKTVAKTLRELVASGEYMTDRERDEYSAWKQSPENIKYMAARYGSAMDEPDEALDESENTDDAGIDETPETVEAPLGQMSLFELLGV